MSEEAAVAQPQKSTVPTVKNQSDYLVQRKCACGGSGGLSGQCDECQSKRLSIQPYASDRSTLSRLNPIVNSSVLNRSSLRPKIQTKSLTSQPGDRHEQEADSVAAMITGAPSSALGRSQISLHPSETKVQCAPEGESSSEPASAPSSGLIVEDDAATLGPGQMRKSDFLRMLHDQIYATADTILPTVGRTAQSCPYIVNWFDYGYSRPGSYVETFIRRFTPGSSRVLAARDYVPLIDQHVRRSLLVWVATGEITGLPETLTDEVLNTNRRSEVERVGAQVETGAIAAAEIASSARQAKALDNHLARDVNPHEIKTQLGSGNSLDSRVKSRMEAAFGYSFSHVRVHHDAGAANLSSKLNARAFTVGNDIAFGTGEYKPGTLIGDALLAHELAHVVQQGGANSLGAMQPGSTGYSALEEDADVSAVGAVASVWGGASGRLKDIGRHAMPRLRSGLRLSRCSSCNEKSEDKEAPPTPTPKTSCVPAAPPGEGWVRNNTAPGKKFGTGDMEGNYYIDASTTAKAEKEPAQGNPVIFKPNYVGSYFTFTDKSKANACSNSGEREWLSYKYYEEACIEGAQAQTPSTGQWSTDIHNFKTSGTDFHDFAGLLVPGQGVAGYFRRTYRVGIICRCTSDRKKASKGFLVDYSYNLDIWFKDNDVAVRVSPGSSYGSSFDWCDKPPSETTCTDSCAPSTPTPAPTTTPTTTPRKSGGK